MPVPKGRGRVVRYRTVKLPGREYMRCEVMEEPGPKGGRTVCGPPRKRKHTR